MNFRQTGILLAAVFAVGLVALVSTLFRDDTAPDTQFLCEELAGTKPEQVDAIEIEREGVGRVKLVRPDPKANNWQMVEPYAAPADGTAAQAIATALLGAKPVPHPELRSNRAEHGLAPAGLRVTLRHGASKASTVSVGDVTIEEPRNGVAFVTTSARDRPMAVPRGELEALFRESKGGVKATDIAKWTEDYRSKSVFPGDSRAFGEDVVLLKVSAPNKKQEFALTRDATGWKFAQPAWGDADPEGADAAASATQFTGVLPLLRTLTNLSAATTTDFLPAPKDPKEFGLNADNPDRVRVEMKTKDGQTAVVFLGKYEPSAAPPPPKKDNPFAPPPPPSVGGKVYAQIENVPGVVRCTAGNLAPLLPTLADPSVLRDRDLIRLAAGKTVDGFDIVLKDQPADRPTKVRRIGGWKLFGGAGDPQSAFGAPVARLIDAATAKRGRDFLAPGAIKFEPVVTLKVWVDGFNAPTAPAAEPVQKAEPVKLEFGPKQGDGVVVRRTLPGGAVSEYIVFAQVKTGAGTETADLLAAVSKAQLNLLDPTLPSFADSAVTKLTVTGAANYTLVRDEKPDPLAHEPLWRQSGGPVVDGGAVRNLLSLVATSQSAFGQFVSENPGNVAEYGLDKPTLKVVVSTGPKPEDERGFEFGKDSPDPDKVYARVIGKPAVFTLQRRAFDRLKTPDLRDRVVLRAIPPAAVTKVQLWGWGHLADGAIVELVFEKDKNGAWAATKAPQGFALDPAKLDAFLTVLATSRARALEPGKHEPKHGFADAKTYLHAHVFWPTGSAAVQLGASPDGGGTNYLWSNLNPDQIAVIDGPPLKPFKDRPATAFGK